MKRLNRARSILDRLLEGIVGVTFFGMAILVMLLVILRYFFNSSIPGGNEALRFAFIYTTFIGSAVLVSRREHIAIHLATKRMPRPIRLCCDVLVHCIIAALSVYLIVLSIRWIAVTGKNLAEELKFPLRYIQVSLPIGCGFAALNAIANAIEAIFDPDGEQEVEA